MSLAHSLALEIVPVDLALPHEHHDPKRVDALAARLVAEGKLVNPPVATCMQGRYIILDGATRLGAFRQLGYPHIILQVVDLFAQQVQLHLWHHLIRGESADALMQLLGGLPGVTLKPATMTPGEPLPEHAFGGMLLADGRCFLLRPAPEVTGLAWLTLLNRIVHAYTTWGKVERTLATESELFRLQYADWAGLMILPRFSVQTILELAVQGHTIPAGITRFLIPGRILRLNAPLERLTSAAPLAEKQAWLEQLLADKVADRQARYYEEPVILLDE